MKTETTPAHILELRDALRREPVGTPARERAVLALADALDARAAADPVTPPPLGVSAEVLADLQHARELVTIQWKGDEELLSGQLDQIHAAICSAIKALSAQPFPPSPTLPHANGRSWMR